MASDISLITGYFPEITEVQLEQFSALQRLYEEWNAQINVISRKDQENLYERHVLHSLGIAKVNAFVPETKVLDVGTGGGFPGIPLAILFPESKFHLVDSIGKKIKVVKAVAEELGLKNLTAEHKRAEEVKGKFDFVVSRAVTKLPQFMEWIQNKFEKRYLNPLPNGVLYLKGGDLDQEIKDAKRVVDEYNLTDYFKEEFFETKKVLYVRMA
ncbi:MAG: 16S rRNA (guanine(527)-N(7))-methyltransferase RsmG [Flavobacteriales bacterium]